MGHHEGGVDEIIRRQAAARQQERAAAVGVGTPGYAAPPSGFSFGEPTGRGTVARIAVLLAIPLVAFLALAKTGGEKGAGLVVMLWVVCGVAFYMLPMIEAHQRKQPNFVSIALVNVFLGWTLVGWVVAMAWGCAARQEGQTGAAPKNVMSPKPDVPPTRPASASSASVADELQKLAALKQQGILSDEEFAAQKAKVLSS